MPYQNHIFVSYAHTDNVKAPDDEMGWVTSFTEYLKVSLTLGLGISARIWRDDKLQGNDQFGSEIEEQFPETAVLVSIVSKRYLQSEWCVKEVNQFCAAAEAAGGLLVDNKARVFRVLMRSIDHERLKVFDKLKDSTLSYPFYTEISVDNQNKGGRREIRLDPRYGQGQDFRLNIELLSDEIVTLIEELEDAATDKPSPTDDCALTVYLAECGYDMRAERDRLVADLRKHGHRVLPDERLPELETDYQDAVGTLLEKCQLSIHLVGAAYGSVPDGPSHKSATILQNEAAVLRAKSSGLKRLIWIPDGIDAQGDEQKAFVEHLHRDAEAQFGADLITGDIETFKSCVHFALDAITGADSGDEAAEPDPKAQAVVYVLCDDRDRKATIPLRKHLQSQGYHVMIPVFKAESAEELRKANEKQLQDCDAVILWYGEGDEAWRSTMASDLRRARGLRGGRPLRASYTYLAAPLSDDKEEMVLMEEPNLINGLDETEFTPARMAAFESELAQ